MDKQESSSPVLEVKRNKIAMINQVLLTEVFLYWFCGFVE